VGTRVAAWRNAAWCVEVLLSARSDSDRFRPLDFGFAGNASGFVFFSGVPAAPLVLGSGCTVEVDLATLNTLVPVVTNAIGFRALSAAVPPKQSLVGLHGALQIALFNTSGPLGFDLSNGLIVTVGY